MSLYQAVVNRFVIPVIEARRAEERAEWQAWNRRRIEAEAQGEPFSEPHSGELPNDRHNGHQTDTD